MTTRDELKALIDKLPEPNLEAVQGMLEYQISPPPRDPEIERMSQRSREFQKRVEERFRETRKPGTCGGTWGSMGGGGSAGKYKGVSFSNNSFHYWDDKALVQQALQSLDGQEIEIMQRFAISPDRSKLLCTFEVLSGGHTVRHEDEFPIPRSEPSGMRDERW